MDHQRFDDLTRALARGRSRRHALKLLGGLATGIGAVALNRKAAFAGGCLEAGGECDVHEDCCGDLACLFGTCGDASICADDGDRCGVPLAPAVRATVVVECCDGFVCDSETSTCVAKEPVCGTDGDNCTILNADLPACCEGFVCDPDSLTCVAEETCLGEGAICDSEGACCEGFICDQELLTCVAEEACGAEDDDCDVDSDCCEGLVCGDGACVAEEQAECETDDDCVAAASGRLPICCAGFCRDLECCIDDEDPNARCPDGTSCFEGVCDPVECGHEGDDCADDQDCCGDLICADGACTAPPVDDGSDGEPVTLPATGTGAGDGGSGLIAGAALVAGAAALLAGKHLRTASEPAE